MVEVVYKYTKDSEVPEVCPECGVWMLVIGDGKIGCARCAEYYWRDTGPPQGFWTRLIAVLRHLRGSVLFAWHDWKWRRRLSRDGD